MGYGKLNLFYIFMTIDYTYNMTEYGLTEVIEKYGPMHMKNMAVFDST